MDFGELQEEGLLNLGFVFSAEQWEPSEARKVTPREIERLSISLFHDFGAERIDRMDTVTECRSTDDNQSH